MSPPILVAGLDGRGLLLEAPVLRRERYPVEERTSAREVLEAIALDEPRLVVLGSRLPDATLPGLLKRIRSSPQTRNVSVLALVGAADPEDTEDTLVAAGANAALRRPLDPAALEAWVAKLLSVARRVQARVPVQAQVVGTPKGNEAGYFYGQMRNVSIAGMLLASPVRLPATHEVELEFDLPGVGPRLRALGRIVREAPEVGWPYLGYGIEFFFLPPATYEAVNQVVDRGSLSAPGAASEAGPSGIHSTLRRAGFVYEIYEPARKADLWHAEIRRSGVEHWRPGGAGVYYVVEGASRGEALEQARDFVRRQ